MQQQYQQNSHMGQQYPSQFGAQPQAQNTLALLGMIFAIVGFFTGGVMTIVGLILSIVGLRQAKRENGNGRGMAMAGVILSIVTMILWLVVWVFIIVFYVLIFGVALLPVFFV